LNFRPAFLQQALAKNEKRSRRGAECMKIKLIGALNEILFLTGTNDVLILMLARGVPI
jgi:hypothetical protein